MHVSRGESRGSSADADSEGFHPHAERNSLTRGHLGIFYNFADAGIYAPEGAAVDLRDVALAHARGYSDHPLRRTRPLFKHGVDRPLGSLDFAI